VRGIKYKIAENLYFKTEDFW